MSVLDDLWYGNYAPQERIGAGGREYKELLGLVVQLREKLEAGLDEAKKELLKKYDDALMKMNLLGEKEAYAAGVKFAIKLAIETMN